MEELLESIWNYIGKGYTHEHEYIGIPDYNDVSFIWTSYYKGAKIASGTSNDHRNYDEILRTWITHSRDRMLKSILDDTKNIIDYEK